MPARPQDAPLPVRAVFFDVDFTLIYPGPTFQGEGYQRFCARHAIEVDPGRFTDAVLGGLGALLGAVTVKRNQKTTDAKG